MPAPVHPYCCRCGCFGYFGFRDPIGRTGILAADATLRSLLEVEVRPRAFGVMNRRLLEVLAGHGL